MTKYEVVDIISRDHLVEKIVFKLLSSSKNPFDCPEDLIQEIYLLLLEKGDKLIVDLYERGELAYYLLRVVRNQLLSKNSSYYYTYIKLGAQSDDISEAAHIPIEDNR